MKWIIYLPLLNKWTAFYNTKKLILYTLTIALPIFLPRSMSMKAFGKFSKPSVMVSYCFILPCNKLYYTYTQYQKTIGFSRYTSLIQVAICSNPSFQRSAQRRVTTNPSILICFMMRSVSEAGTSVGEVSL